MDEYKSEFITVKIRNKNILIPKWCSMHATKEYFSSYEQYKDYRKAFCNLVFTMVKSKIHNNQSNDVILEDIESISEDTLKIIMNMYLNKNTKLNKYFQIKSNKDYFETFYLAYNEYLDNIKKQMADSIKKCIPHIPRYEIYKPIIPWSDLIRPTINLMQYKPKIIPIIKIIKPKVITSLNQVNKNMFNFAVNIKQAMQPFINSITTMQELYKPVINNISKQFIEISKKLEKFNKEVQQFKRIIIALGFPPHLTLMENEISRIVYAYNTYGEEKARNVTYDIYIKHFNNEMIKEITNEWYHMVILNDRKKIIRQAVVAHLHGEYYLSIPVMFSQIEGLIANIFHHKGSMGGKKYLDYIELLLNDKKDYSFDDLIYTFYDTVVLASFHHNEPIESFLSRHAILHGGDINYGTKINSIKALLLFDYMIDKMNEYVNRENKLLDKSS